MTTYTECPTTGFKIPKEDVIHELKILPQYFRAVEDGSKTFEVRKNDRGFQKGDYVILREWNPEMKTVTDEGPHYIDEWEEPRGYTGDSLTFRIGYVLSIDAERVVFSLIKEKSL